MNERMRHLLDQLNELEVEIESEMNHQKKKWFYEVQGRRVEFEHSIKDAHRRLKIGVIHWFMSVRFFDYLTAPIIYGMVFPLFVFDLLIMFYQFTCFPIYGIARVKRSDYFSFDHRHLSYLNLIEKFDCLYCSYANGLMGYASEIIACTEQYFCPIKHAQKLLGSHKRNRYFLEYGDASDLHKRLEKVRSSLLRENDNKPIP